MVDKIFKQISRLILPLLGLWLFFDLASHLTAEILWFGEVGYLPEFLLRLKTQLGLGAIAFLVSSGFLLLHLALASRLKHPSLQAKRGTRGGLRLRFLLPVVLGLSVVAGLILIYYGQKAFNFWDANIKLPSTTLHLAPWLQQVFKSVHLQQLPIPMVQLGLLLGLIIAILINPQFFLRAIALLISLLLSFLLSGRWVMVLEYFHATNFNRTEPLFNQDISFYVFSLPIWEMLEFWLLGLFLYSMVAVALIYLQAANSLSEGFFAGFSIPQRLHLHILASLLMLVIALHYWLARYQLLYSTKGVNYGASYTPVNVQLPIYTSLYLLAVAIAIYLLLRMIILSKELNSAGKPISLVSYPRHLVYVLGLYLAVAVVGGEILPLGVQRLIVQPNELARERPYIGRTITLTRQAFNLNKIEAQTFDPQGQLSASDLQANNLTIRNIRLWDKRPLLETNRQLQQIRPYYKFPDAQIDRYTLKKQGVQGESEKQQTIIAARELDYSAVPGLAKTWVNEHLVYTHGYGFTLSPVNIVGAGGLPDYYVKDIGVDNMGKEGSLQISDAAIEASIPIGQPRIYYGENTNTYVMTGTKTQELDYPSGNENVYNVYDGGGGIKIGAPWRRLLFAQYLKDWQMLLTQDFTSETKLLFRRNILERVRAIAPFFRYDSDPYLVVADGGGTNVKGEKTYLYWILDAYTTSDRYPYSDPGLNRFNYIRNSVKIVIDAYNGDVNFYVADPQDPIINTFSKIFPNLLKPLSSMPSALRSHIRYPQDLFYIQSERLLTYHMIDPQVFYNREDLWQIPSEIYGSETQQVKPYYLIMKLPKAQSEEFILLLPFKPVQRANLIAWLAARSDGLEYGKLLLYEFPKQQLVYGTEQIEALINQDPVISQQISLWNRQGSRAIQGNLLVIPIERCLLTRSCASTLLYVEPLYLEAEKNSLPTLVRVIVAYNNRIVMAESLEQALSVIFQAKKPTTPAIVRPVEKGSTDFQDDSDFRE
ncbi:MAG: UPF0182 family protein [Stigonema ocellatum SAG 48.90 = DSM 106950]|nr:UPF0182 family protein [Stigonema ocellatum SAG 48.90 = DSM 106950]